MKENDWIVAALNNPDFTAADFKNILEMSLDNTLLLSKDQYLKSSFITEHPAFLENGTFNKDKFDKFYDKLAAKFKNFSTESLIDNYQYGFWDTSRKTAKAETTKPSIGISIVPNPEHISTGVVGVGMRGEKTKTAEELAQSNKIFDYELGEFKEETPEDSSLFRNPVKFLKSIFSDPLVMALYDEDGTHIDPITKLLVQHRKGEYKVGNNGQYYYETLEGRSVIGKKVLSLGDVLTPEDSALNGYDFFDCDDIDKSATGVIAKNLALIAPMIFLGPVSSLAYNGFFVVKELAKALPMLYQMTGMLSGQEKDSKLLNNLAAWGLKFTTGTSEYAKEKMFSFENIGNLISDVALLWGQLRAIAESISRLGNGGKDLVDAVKTKALIEYLKLSRNILANIDKGIIKDAHLGLRYIGISKADELASMLVNNKWMETQVGRTAINKFMPAARKAFENRLRFGQDLSLAYMAIISNTDVYELALLHGATRNEAAGIALGSTLGMFAVDKYLDLGRVFFNDQDLAKIFRQSLRNYKEKQLDPIIKSFAKLPESKEKSLNLILQSIDSTKKFIKDYRTGLKELTLGFFGRAFGEGLEEVSEELVTDMVKSLYQLGGQFGYFSQTDVGAWDNMLERYAMNFLGGFIGGGMFYGIDAIKHPKSKADKNSRDEFMYYVRNNELLSVLEEGLKMFERGEWGSTELSIDKVKDENGEDVYLPVSEQHKMSLNEFVWNGVKNALLLMDAIINGNLLNITDDKLFERMLLADEKLLNLEDSESLKDAAYMAGYFKEFLRITLDIYEVDKQIAELNGNTLDGEKRAKDSNYEKSLKSLEEKKKLLETRKEEFFNEGSVYYFLKSLFAMNPNISGLLLPINYNRYVRIVYGKNPQDLTFAEKEESQKGWEEYKKNSRNLDLTAAFDLFYSTLNNLFLTLNEIKNEEVSKWEEISKNLAKYRFIGNADDNVVLRSITPEELEVLLKELGVTKTNEYDKPWKSDSTKTNKAIGLYLNEDSHNFFELVKDNEDHMWSIHFKTDSPTVLNEKQKQRLFLAAALLIPEGDVLSTRGEITQGGIAGLNRFRELGFEKVGERSLRLRSPYFKNLTNEELETEKEKYLSELAKLSEKAIDKYLYEQIENLNSELKKRNKQEISLDSYTQSEVGDESKLEIIIVPELKKSPIGETEEEFKIRNELQEGETEAQFKLRLLRRERLVKAQLDRDNKKILKELNSTNSVIDSNTYRYLMSSLGERSKDIIRFNFKNWQKEYPEAFSIIKNLKEDLSNVDFIELQILENIEANLKNQFSLLGAGVNISAKSLYDEEGNVTVETILNWLLNEASYHKNSDETVKDIDAYDIGEALNILDSEDIEKIVDFINILNFLDNTKKAPSFTAVTLNSNYNEHSSGEEISDIVELSKLRSELGEYITQSSDKILGYDLEGSEEYIKNTLEKAKKEFNQIIDSIKRDDFYSQIEILKKKLTMDLNPTVKLLKALVTSLGLDFSGIEETLQTIWETYDELNSIADFLLNEPLIAALEEAKKYILLGLAVITAASEEDSYDNPLPYNKTINEWLRTHRSEIKGDFKELVELDLDVANVYKLSLYKYLYEIDTWIERARSNLVNKVKMFTEFDSKFEAIKEDFFKRNLPHFELPDGTNLLEGFVDKNDSFQNVLEYERCLYKNTLKALNRGVSKTELFTVISKIVDLSKALNLQISNLDLSLERLTDYDKFIYIIASMCYNPDNFYLDYKQFIEENKGNENEKGIAPLSMLKHIIRLKKAQENNMSFINDMLEIFKEITGSKNPILYNATISTGIGGSGKTTVCAKAVIQDGAWVSGPTKTLVDALIKLSKTAVGKSKEELMRTVLGDLYGLFYDDLKNLEKATILKFVPNDSGNNVDISSLKVQTTKEAPKQLIIDEITLFANAEILAICAWANKNNVSLYFIGDENLNGDSSAGHNIARENSIAFRTPKLSISLREANVWKYLNLLILSKLEDNLRSTNSVEETASYAKYLIDLEFKRLRLKNYSKSLTGDLIVDQLTSDQIAKLDGKILYVGQDTDETYKKLKDAGKLVEIYSKDTVQGQEEDYIVSNINISNFDKSNPFEVLDFMRNLYTIITRSKKGSIIIDNGLTTIVGESEEQSYSTNVIQFNTESINEFVRFELDRLKSITFSPESTTTTKEEKKEIPDPKKAIQVEQGISSPLMKPLDESEKNKKAVERSEREPLPVSSELPIHVYTNFNVLGLNRSEDGKTWLAGPKRDLGIFVTKDTSDALEHIRLKDLYMSLKSNILNNDGFDNLPIDVKVALGNDKNVFNNAKYYIVKEKYDKDIHYFVTVELNQKPPKEDTIYTLLMRFNVYGKENILTLGFVATPDNLLNTKSIIEDLLNNNLKKVTNSETILSLITNLKGEIEKYRAWLNDIDDEIEIDTPYFDGYTGLRYIKHTNETTGELYSDWIRLEEVNSPDSVYRLVTEAYVTSPIYTQMAGDPGVAVEDLGKPFILVSSLKRLSPDELLNVWEEELKSDYTGPIRVRKILLHSAGVSFEALFNDNYKSSFNVTTVNEKTYTFPFDLLPMGVRMYTSLWNFRANLYNLVEPLKERYKNLDELTKIAQEEDRLYLTANNAWLNDTVNNKDKKDLTKELFEEWLNNNEDLILENLTKELIFDLRQFNDTINSPIKLGWNQESGAYVRKINSEEYGIYLNPELAILYLTTVENLFTQVFDKILPNLLDSGLSVKELTNYKVSDKDWSESESNWVKKAKHGSIVLKLSNGEDYTEIKIAKADLLKAIPLAITQITKNILATTRMSNLLRAFKNYLSDADDHYAFTLKTVSGDVEFVDYLKILDGGLGSLIKEDFTGELIPGVFRGEKTDSTGRLLNDKVRDRRLINMFNIAFHGSTYIGEANDFKKNKPLHADFALFPYGFFVDPILGLKMSTNQEKYRPIIISGKYYFVDVVPTSPKVYFIPKKKGKSKVELKIEVKTEENPIIQQLSLLEEVINIKSLENCENNKELEDTINEELRKILEGTNKNGGVMHGSVAPDVEEFLNLPYKIEIVDDKVNIFRIKDLKDIKGKSIEFELEDGKLYININGIRHIMSVDENNIPEFSATVNPSVESSLTLQAVRSHLENNLDEGVLKAFDKFITNNPTYVLNNLYNESGFRNLLESIIKKIENSTDLNTLDLKDELEEIKKNPYCIL